MMMGKTKVWVGPVIVHKAILRLIFPILRVGSVVHKGVQVQISPILYCIRLLGENIAGQGY